MKSEPAASGRTSSARMSASESIPNVTVPGNSAASRRPYGSSDPAIRTPGSISNNRRLARKYDSMSGWKSRWSWLRLVKTEAVQWMPSARRSSSACDEISIAQATSPASSISRNVRWRSIASGVVRSIARRSPPTNEATVPSRPLCIPAASSIARVSQAVVVFPLVPVTPTTCSSRVGSP